MASFPEVTSYNKCLKKLTGGALLGTWRCNFQPPTPTLSATLHNVTDRQTDRQTNDSMIAIAE